MKEWSHDELHQLMNADPRLKDKSNKVYSMPAPVSLDEWGEQKHRMMQIYAEAVGCKQFADAANFLDNVLEHIKKHCSSLEDWKSVASLPEHRDTLQTLGETFKAQKKCCSPEGNDYVCYCDEPLH